MRRFFPYLKYLKRVRLALAAGILCGVLYGAVNGLGVPLMVKIIIPRVLTPDAAPSANAKTGGAWNFASWLERWADDWIGKAPDQPAPVQPQPPQAASRPQINPLKIWALALWLPLIFIIRGITGYLNTYFIQYA